MKIKKAADGFPRTLKFTLARALMVAGFLFCAAGGLSQTTPVLTIASLGTNQFSITITNGMSGGNYELWWTPVLNNTIDYPWTAAAVGTMGQTNFTLNMGVYQTGFFRALQDTNSIPLWEAADPNNQATGILNVWIDSPTNGATLN
jgi:hypothetical protein